MGEYATYKGEEIKIGTCNCMYYLRWEQRNDVIPRQGNVNPRTQYDKIWFRAPRHCEDGIEPGDFDFQGWCGVKPIRFFIKDENSNFAKEVKSIAKEAQSFKQVRCKEIGVNIRVPCCHGYTTELPDRMGYNGFNPNTLGISALGVRQGKAVAFVGCVACELDFLVLDFEELVRYCRPFGDEKADFEYCLQTMMQIEADLLLEHERMVRYEIICSHNNN